MLTPNDLKKGVVFKYKSSPVEVLAFSHTHKGRGSAIVSIKLKDLVSGNVQSVRLKAGDRLEEADLARLSANFLYQDQGFAYFMNEATYEQVSLAIDKIKEKIRFLQEGQIITIVEFEGQAIAIDLPPKVELKIIEAEPGVKGNTADGTAYKPAIVESGYKLNVPIFIKRGDVIKINTETGEYVERVS